MSHIIVMDKSIKMPRYVKYLTKRHPRMGQF
jgi:hypothetical protein